VLVRTMPGFYEATVFGDRRVGTSRHLRLPKHRNETLLPIPSQMFMCFSPLLFLLIMLILTGKSRQPGVSLLYRCLLCVLTILFVVSDYLVI